MLVFWSLAALLLAVTLALLLRPLLRARQVAAAPHADAAAIDGRNPHEIADPQIVAMVDSLAQRLKARPDDADGWALLARSYQALGRFPEAADAYAHADALIPDNAALLADYADVLAMAQGRKLAGKPAALAQRALAIDPKHRKALALAATAALEAGDLEGAL